MNNDVRVRRRPKLLTFLGVSLAVLIAAGLALQIAIWRNGPAVLDAVDRITGGARGAVLAERVSYGPSDKQYLSVYTPKDPLAEPLLEPLPVIVSCMEAAGTKATLKTTTLSGVHSYPKVLWLCWPPIACIPKRSIRP